MHIFWFIFLLAFILTICFMLHRGCNPSTIEEFKGCSRRGHHRGNHGGRHGSYNQWQGRNQFIWWNTPLYYANLPYSYDNDPCNCYGKYKSAIDFNIPQDIAAINLVACVQQTLNGEPCI